MPLGHSKMLQMQMLVPDMQVMSISTRDLLIGCKLPPSLPHARFSGDIDGTRSSLLIRAQAFPAIPQPLALPEALSTARSKDELYTTRPLTRKHQQQQEQQMSKSVALAAYMRQVCPWTPTTTCRPNVCKDVSKTLFKARSQGWLNCASRCTASV